MIEHLKSAPVAYENDTFLNGPDGRTLRILAEYPEPLARFRRQRIQDTVVFFGSARFSAAESGGAVASPPVAQQGPRPPRSWKKI